VLSTTTPFFALLLSALGRVWPDLPHLANLIGAFSLALGGAFIWVLGRTWRAPAVGWVGVMLYPTFNLLLITMGSETPLYLALCLGSFVFYIRRRYRLTAILAALAVLVRPDGLLVPVVLAAHYLFIVRRPIPWRAVVLFLILALPWFLFAWAYFGSPLPATLAAKQQQGSLVVSQRFAAGLLSTLRGYADRWENWLLALLALAGVYHWLRHFGWVDLRLDGIVFHLLFRARCVALFLVLRPPGARVPDRSRAGAGGFAQSIQPHSPSPGNSPDRGPAFIDRRDAGFRSVVVAPAG
jgi:hypothetical protein